MRQFVMKMWTGMMMLGMVCLWLSSCAAASVTDRGISVSGSGGYCCREA